MERVVLNAFAMRMRRCRLISAPSGDSFAIVPAQLRFHSEPGAHIDELCRSTFGITSCVRSAHVALVRWKSYGRGAGVGRGLGVGLARMTFKLCHHPVVLVLHHVAMEHVHPGMIGEL